MEIKVTQDQKHIRKVREFLGAIVVNKALFWPLHFSSHLTEMQRLGIGIWEDSQGRRLSDKWAKRKAKMGLSDEVNNYSGGTKDQATFQSGDAEIHITGRGNVLVNIAPGNWVPRGKEPKWRSKYNDRPFWYLNKARGRQFWRPGSYIDLKTADKSIWKSPLPEGEVDLKEAQKLLIMTVAQANKVLRENKLDLGSWQKGRPKGVASRWH